MNIALKSFLGSVSLFHSLHDDRPRAQAVRKLMNEEFTREPDARPQEGVEIAKAFTAIKSTHGFFNHGYEWRLGGELTGAPDEVLANIAKARRVWIRIDSPGGDYAAAVKILDALKGKRVAVRATYAGSAAGFLLAASPGRRTIAPTGSVMLHRPSCGGLGDAAHLRGLADWLDANESRIIDRMAARTRRERSQVRDWFSGGDVRFTAQQALEAGLVDEISL